MALIAHTIPKLKTRGPKRFLSDSNHLHCAFRYSLKEAQADKLLMATAVIAAATYISNQEHTDVVRCFVDGGHL